MPYQFLFADPANEVEVHESNYTVPYVMWANYDVDWEEQEITSLNYLSAILKQNAGLPADSWDSFRMELMQKYPAINSYGVVDADGNYLKLNDVIAESDAVKEYRNLQYYRSFDAVKQSK